METIIGLTVGLFSALLLLGMPIWIIWIVMHYKAKGRRNDALSEDDYRQLRELNVLAERIAERIKNLETILDVEAPQWRDQERVHGAGRETDRETDPARDQRSYRDSDPRRSHDA